MPVSFSVPKSPEKSVYQINEFKGVDFSNSPANIDDNKSPNAINMIRDVPDKIRKRMGYEVIKTFEDGGNINGVHYRREDDTEIYHVGTKMYKDDEVIYEGANDAISHSWQFNTNLYIMDGKAMLKYDGETLDLCSRNSYIPTLTISKEPTGGGTEYEAINLLNPAFIELFTVTEETKTATEFYLTFGDLDSTTVKAWLLNDNGDWVEKTEGTDFTVNRTTGVVTFSTAPGKSPLNGEDNVKIQAYRTVEGYADRINKCTFGTRFGVNGAFDRLFVSGNPDYPNSDWYSEQWDCTYFPDTGYSLLGSSRSAIVGYSIISNYLAAHKDEMEQDLSIVLREGDLVDDKPSFKIINTLQGAGAIATNSFAYLCTEPLFLTRSGLYAVTAQDITGEKYAQSRSFYLNGKLTQEKFEDLQKSFAIIFNDMYLLSVDHDRLYVLDGLQPIRTDKSEPYSTRQYVGFYCDNLPIHYMWERENRLYFGTQDGKICRFYKDKENQHSYNDNGEPIYCQWETPDIDGQLFYKNKSLRYIAVRVGAAIATSLEVWVMDRGIWKFVKKDTSFGRYFSFQYMIFSKLAFSGNKTQKISRTKVRVKRVDKYRLRFVNDELDEPFSIYNIANEYTERGNYKG